MANVIYNPYNTTIPNTGAMQPGTLQPSNYQVAQQPMMPVNNYQSTTMPLMNTAGLSTSSSRDVCDSASNDSINAYDA